MQSSANPLQTRAAGLLMHVTSLPGPSGCGDLGPEAHRFVDFLADAGLRWWQMLPINPPGPGNSPYSAYSAFAGSPLLVSLHALYRDGLLKRRDLRPESVLTATRTDYPATRAYREPRLRRAFAAYQGRSGRARRADEEVQGRFRTLQRGWLKDFTLYCALRRRDGGNWTLWPAPLRQRRADALAEAARSLHDEIAFHEFVQFAFFRQWAALQIHCRNRRVWLLGDVPIFVAHQSSDVWAHPELFELESDGRLRLQSGVPPDNFSRSGQLWRHPLYRWPRHRATRVAWGIERFRRQLPVTSLALHHLHHMLPTHR